MCHDVGISGHRCKKIEAARGHIPLLVFLLAFLLQLRHVHPGVGWRDSGELTSAAATLGVAHPTGYGLFLLLEKAMGELPFGSLPMRMNLGAGLAFAGAACVVFRVVSSLGKSQAAAILSALLFATLPVLRETALNCEVYPLLLLLLSLLCLGVVQRRGMASVFFLLGMSIGHHLTAMLLCPGLAFGVLWPERRRILWPACLAAFILGFSICLVLPLRAAHAPVRMWIDVSHWRELLVHMAGLTYQGRLGGAPLDRMAIQLVRLISLLCHGAYLPLILAVPACLSVARRSRARAATLGLCAMPLLLFCLTYDTTDISDFAPHAFPLLAGAAVLAGMGPASLSRGGVRWGAWGLSLMAVALLAISAAGPAGRRDESPEEFMRPLWQQAPRGAWVITAGDNDTFLTWYAQIVEERRRDVVHLGVYQGEIVASVSMGSGHQDLRRWIGVPWRELPSSNPFQPIFVAPGAKLDKEASQASAVWDAWWRFGTGSMKPGCSEDDAEYRGEFEFEKKVSQILARSPLTALNRDFTTHLGSMANAQAERQLLRGRSFQAIDYLAWGSQLCPDHPILQRNFRVLAND